MLLCFGRQFGRLWYSTSPIQEVIILVVLLILVVFIVKSRTRRWHPDPRPLPDLHPPLIGPLLSRRQCQDHSLCWPDRRLLSASFLSTWQPRLATMAEDRLLHNETSLLCSKCDLTVQKAAQGLCRPKNDDGSVNIWHETNLWCCAHKIELAFWYEEKCNQAMGFCADS